MFVAVQAGCWTFYTMLLLTIILLGTRRYRAILQQDGLEPISVAEQGRWYSLGRVVVIAGVTIGSLGWMIGLATAAEDRLSVGIVVGAIVILTWWANHRVRKKTGEDSEVRTLLELVLLIVATTLIMVNWQLQGWIATTRGVALAELQRSMPLWSVNLCASVLAVWVGALLLMTRPRRTNQSGASTA
jgi:hydrogenase-4 membrane subunit HyfE